MRKTRRGYDRGLKQPRFSIMSRTHSSLVGLRLTVVSAGFTIWTEDICLEGLGNKQGEKILLGRKTKRNMEETPERPTEDGSVSPYGQNRCHMSQMNAQTSFKSDTVDLIVDLRHRC